MSESRNEAKPTTRRRKLVAGAVATGAIVMLVVAEWGSILGLRSEGPTFVPPQDSPKVATPGVSGGPTPVRAFNAPQIPPPTPEGGRSALADSLNAPGRTARDDVATVAELLANYLEVFRKLPVGTNPEITAALAGDNARGLAPLPPDHRAINAAGELADRWKTPFFFHQVSREIMEVRSAGPDRKHFTADDIVWPEVDATVAPAGLAQMGGVATP